ncbi:hypothetical protein BT63DRAFT_437893 [Microthyrium microscopicum]|uniref:Protein PNS1 n=1 Tax=Microthyrium microscopicum TaxID=703497 RepID=A0A6A6UIH2_9PEZI|nr:hypothetical protein BT63DRAFT_437893 [Microthyrium microscopicum]
MFSEYASRFLAQSQSRPPNGHQQQNPSSPTRNSSNQQQSNSRFGGPSFLRQNMPGPYNQSASQFSRFPFASRTQNAQAPLFLNNAADEFREEDDGEEHQREVADFYALQRSRRAFGPSHLTESSEGDDYVDHSSHADETVESHETEDESPFGRPRGQGIKSSWRGEREEFRGRKGKEPAVKTVLERPERRDSVPASTSTRAKSQKLVDVELSESEHSSVDNLEEEDYGPEESAPAYSGFNFKSQTSKQPQQGESWIPDETDDETSKLYQKPRSIDGDSVLPTLDEVEEDPQAYTPKHDAFWATLYLISFASLFASAFLVYLHTDTPGKQLPDTIYTILRAQYGLLAKDTLIAVIVAALWLSVLRSFLRPLTYLTVFAVPIILFSFALWPFISSFKTKEGGTGRSAQGKAMAIFSTIPLLGAMAWTYLAIQSRHSIDRAIQILELASKILTASPALVMAGVAAVVTTVIWFWLWLVMFTRVFLEGHVVKKVFLLDVGTWWLGVFFFLMLLWTQLVISGVQRATTAATVSQWYFYRSSGTTASSRDVVIASFVHASGPLFGTICLSTLISLLIRLPLLLLPRRLVGMCAMCIYAMTPAPIASLTNPLTLTYAAIHSQPLAVAARGLTRLPLSANSPARSFRDPRASGDTLAAYRTTHMLLHATRQIMTLALGLGAWVSVAYIKQEGGGSAYAYVVGLGAAVIGWSVLGAVEGIMGGVVDGVLVCWGSEVAAGRQGRQFCPEAAELFGEPERRAGARIMV